MADRVLRELGKAKADAAYKVSCPSNCAKVHFANDNRDTHTFCACFQCCPLINKKFGHVIVDIIEKYGMLFSNIV